MEIVRRAGVRDLIHERRAKAAARWDRHASIRAFIQDAYPAFWPHIERCRQVYRVMEWVQKPGWYRVVPAYTCHLEPFCLNCVRSAHWRRVLEAFEKFQRCTPAGERPRFVHIVQTAPLTEDDQGWGLAASQNVPAFAKLVWQNLKEFYGPGIGAVMSYQDFGERPFVKRHPHLDLTLNGWMLQDGQAVHTPRIDLSDSGEAWHTALTAKAAALDVTARRGTFNVQEVRVGVSAYRKALLYQMREMVDLSHYEYDRAARVIEYRSYKDGARVRFTIPEFKAGLEEYRWRLKQWPQEGEEGMSLHRWYGHMASRSIRKTQKLVGGTMGEHGQDCPCNECSDWERVWLDAEHEEPATVEPVAV